jgi:hypothetical protein
MKEFDGELYLGKVVAWMNATEEDEALFHVLYEDNDEEDLCESETNQFIALYNKYCARQKVNPTRISDLGRLVSLWTKAQRSKGAVVKSKINQLKETKACNSKESSEKCKSTTKSDKSSIAGLKVRSSSPPPIAAYSGNRSNGKKVKCDLDEVKSAFLKLISCLNITEEQRAASHELFLDELETQVSTSTSAAQLGRVLEWLIDELQGDARSLASTWAKRCDWCKWKDKLSHIKLPSQVGNILLPQSSKWCTLPRPSLHHTCLF